MNAHRGAQAGSGRRRHAAFSRSFALRCLLRFQQKIPHDRDLIVVKQGRRVADAFYLDDQIAIVRDFLLES